MKILLAVVLYLVAAMPLSAAVKTVTLAVDRMTCAACPIIIKKAISRVEGVSRVEVSYERREAVVTFDDAKTTVDALKQASANVGFPVQLKP